MSAVAGRRTYTEDELQAALRDIQSGKLGTRRAAVIYGIPRSTLRNKVYKMALERERESHLNSSTPRNLDEDEALDDDKELSGTEEEKEVEKALQVTKALVHQMKRLFQCEVFGVSGAATFDDRYSAVLWHGASTRSNQAFSSKGERRPRRSIVTFGAKWGHSVPPGTKCKNCTAMFQLITATSLGFVEFVSLFRCMQINSLGRLQGIFKKLAYNLFTFLSKKSSSRGKSFQKTWFQSKFGAAQAVIKSSKFC